MRVAVLQANRWCQQGVNQLATQQIESIKTHEGAQAALRDVEELIASSQALQLGDQKEMAALFDAVMTPATKVGSALTLRKLKLILTAECR